MAVFRKLYQPLLSCRYKFHTNFLLKQYELTKQIPNTRKIIPLNIIIEKNADVYDNIKNENLLNIKWQSIRERFLQIQQITAATVDSIIIETCLVDFQVDKAIAYFKFLRENNYPLNVGVIGNYLRLYVLKCDLLTEADKMEIINTYNALRKNHPYLDSVTAEHCVVSLCLTDQWEKTDELIELIKITTTPSIKAYSAIADAAFRNGKSDVAWKALLSIVSRKQILQHIVYKSHLQYCESEGMEEIFNNRMEEMFDFWSEHSMMPYNYIINAYADRATKYGWHTIPTTICKTGSCKYCGHSLSKITLNKNSFQELAESVMNKLIIGSDIYYKTNPQELQRFKKFIEKTKPYDIVIDGLNVFYMQKTSTAHALETLIKVVEHFSQHKKKILVVTRKHQKKLPNWKYIQQHALVFFIDNMSADDVYMLYATMASGENAMFVSLDLLRQHKHSLKDLHLQQEFKKWQYSHQYFVRKNGTSRYFKIEEPFIYLPTVQKNGDCWHIPYVSDDFTYADLHEFPNKWYCFKYDKKKK
ncbi:mitochondrial ribonuclease P catalytic subunit [Linepithema humile]|uniref:mitochondrial ribonuclease P catalytic subunit n=1 Tax=Linepithema humile TaxID=83485 RepID=UPI0006232906|nr:PREDICTED: mitochondrial ribonuclease P protein 3 [Linepithema humile]XP_012227716.1 PREDICTED: mitochondrial ribonuclease P protein 3 [Linepithema humile]XP_012227717.1 PREDICTED: mitochondrial ribonuclease P protein 3 [Linepithema humile]